MFALRYFFGIWNLQSPIFAMIYNMPYSLQKTVCKNIQLKVLQFFFWEWCSFNRVAGANTCLERVWQIRRICWDSVRKVYSTLMEEINWKIARLLQFIISNVFPMYLLHRLARVTGKRNVILPPTVILIYMFWTVSTQGSTVINFRCVLLCEASFKTYFNAVPKNTFWDIFLWTSPKSYEEFSKSISVGHT